MSDADTDTGAGFRRLDEELNRANAQVIDPSTDTDRIQDREEMYQAVLDYLGCSPEDVQVEETQHDRFPEATALNIVVDESTLLENNVTIADLLNKFNANTISDIVVSVNSDSESDDDSPSPDEILRTNAEIFQAKNEDYGSSWKLAGETLAMWAQELDADIDLQDEDEAISFGLYYQRVIKLTRAFNLEYGHGDPNNEPIAESHSDESTYAGIHTSHAKE